MTSIASKIPGNNKKLLPPLKNGKIPEDILEMPHEILFWIVSVGNVNARDLVNLSSTCKSMRNFLMSPGEVSEMVWKSRCSEDLYLAPAMQDGTVTDIEHYWFDVFKMLYSMETPFRSGMDFMEQVLQNYSKSCNTDKQEFATIEDFRKSFQQLNSNSKIQHGKNNIKRKAIGEERNVRTLN